jgi:beta-N-acetylhexosaminidase
MLAMTSRKSENRFMKSNSLRYDVAQMVMPRLNGTDLEDAGYRAEIEALIREGMGGFILFGGDIENTPERLRELQARADTPLLITSDVERGLWQQLAGGTRFPGQRAVASAINPRSKKDAALLDRMLDAVRAETRRAGIHAVFSPVVDVNNNPDNPIICTRAFGDEPGVVEWFGSRYIKKLQKSRSAQDRVDLLACAKHFPGHGDTDQDSHAVLPVIRADKPRLNRIELPPFREAVKSGVGMVMVAHLLVPALDPNKPTTFSKKIITALLREGMAFDGLIVSDALDMGALTGEYSPEEIAVRAVEAGIDILLHPKDARLTIDAVVSGVEEGRLTHARIRESVERILSAKKRLGLFDEERPKVVSINYEKNRRIAEEIGQKAIRILSGNKKLLPLKTAGDAACFVLDDDGEGKGEVFLRELSRRFGTVSVTVLTPQGVLPPLHLHDSAASTGLVVLPIFSKISASKGRSGISSKLREAGAEILRASKAAGRTSVVISFDSPYILTFFKEADILVAAYDGMEEIQRAAVDLLAGKA